MLCPRCGNEWDVSKSPCSNCGLLVHVPGRSSGVPRTNVSSQNYQMPGRPSFSVEPPAKETMPTPPPSNPSTAFPFGQPHDAQAFSAGSPMLPNTPRPVDFSATYQHYTNDMQGGRAEQKDAPHGQQRTPSNGTLPAMNAPQISPPQKNVPSRPMGNPSLARSTDALPPEPQRSLRPSRLVTDHLSPREKHPFEMSPAVSLPAPMAVPRNVAPLEVRQLLPGTVLRSGRYRLRELLERQEWMLGVYEATWIAQDAQRGAAEVQIRELFIPESASTSIQATVRNATTALASVSRHPTIPTLWDAFSELERSFFVFELVEGESLLDRMRRTKFALPEQDVIECCLQMTDVLEALAQQSPPLIHGLIRPEHILARRSVSQYVLINSSIVLAGGAMQFVSGMDRSRVSPYAPPEFVRGNVDVRSDLYSLLATAYHAVTGSVPAEIGSSGTLPQARQLNPHISREFDAILNRGLRPAPAMRYQTPAELRQDLLFLRSTASSRGNDSQMASGVRSGGQLTRQNPPAFPQIPDRVAQVLPNLLAQSIEEDDPEGKLLLPRPEDLPPMAEGNDVRLSLFWLVGILACLLVLVFLSRGLS